MEFPKKGGAGVGYVQRTGQMLANPTKKTENQGESWLNHTEET